MQEVGLVGDEEQHLGRDRVGRTPGEPVLGVDPDLEVDEAAAERGRHAVDDAAVGFAVAAGDERRALAAGRMPLLTGYGGGDSIFDAFWQLDVGLRASFPELGALSRPGLCEAVRERTRGEATDGEGMRGYDRRRTSERLLRPRNVPIRMR